MNTCVNCNSPAEFVLTTPTPANYCESHLPRFARKTNQFVSFTPIPDVVPPVVEPDSTPPAEAPAPKSSKKKTTSEAPAEETTAPAEEPTP
jgi:hypothetical protein